MRDSFFRIIVVVLLALNTFFIGSMWKVFICSPCGYASKASLCPFSAKKGSGKICPITGKSLESVENTSKVH